MSNNGRIFTLSELDQQPVTLNVTWQDGTAETLVLPLLRMRDYAPMLDEETKRRQDAARKTLGALQAIDKHRALQAIELQVATVPDLAPMVQTPAGGERVIRASMTRANVPPEKQEQIFDLLPAWEQDALAVTLSTLFVQTVPKLDPTPATKGPAVSGPLDSDSGAKTASATDTATTGSSTTSGSVPSSEATPST